jgi:hypothetical protein
MSRAYIDSTIAARLQEKRASRGEEVGRAWKICFIEKQAYKQKFLNSVRPTLVGNGTDEDDEIDRVI